MHLVTLTAENFRLFGSESAGAHLHLEIKRGLTVLVGENDAGKSAVIDALRLVLGAKGQDFLRVTDDDFHREKGVPADSFRLHCRFEGLSEVERARFMEWLSLEEKEPILEITLLVFRAKRKNRNGVETFVADSSWRSGPKGAGRAIEGDLRSYLLSTYLKPLRDAEMEMAAGRGSRLSQLLLNHPDHDLARLVPVLAGHKHGSELAADHFGHCLRAFVGLTRASDLISVALFEEHVSQQEADGMIAAGCTVERLI